MPLCWFVLSQGNHGVLAVRGLSCRPSAAFANVLPFQLLRCWFLQSAEQSLLSECFFQQMALLLRPRFWVFFLQLLLQGNHGVLGVSGLSCSPSPVHVPGLWEVGVLQIAAGEAHCAALGANGFAYTWGRGKYGQLGHGSFEDEEEPRQVCAQLAVFVFFLDCMQLRGR